jgi:hypothetical protein
MATLVAALLCCSPALSAAKTSPKAKAKALPAVPQGFAGVDIDGPMYGPDTTVNLNNQFGSMVTNGVQSVRVAFSWAFAQPYQSMSDVPSADQDEYTPVAGVPTNFQITDQVVADAASHRITVLPTVLYTPDWDAKANDNNLSIPKRTAPYAAYLTGLIGRYGPHGSFWAQNPGIPKVPIRTWQIWNEPNISFYWPQPFASSYVPLVRAAHSAIKRADPGAKVMLGALTNQAWKSLEQVDKVRGAAGQFDIVSVNGFTKTPADVMFYLNVMRRAMNSHGQRKTPLVATEFSWPSARGKSPQHFDFNTTEAGQARNIATLLPLLGQQRRSLGLIGFDYYTWMGEEDENRLAFNFGGLLRFYNGRVTAKPALAAYRKGVLALEHCRRKGAVATSCIR